MTLPNDVVADREPPTARRAVIAGFSTGLSEVLMDYLAERGFAVRQLATLQEAAHAMLEVPAELFVVSGRKHIDAVVAVAEQLGTPRTTRIVVLLPGEDRALLAQYRRAGIHWVLTMPATPDRIDAAALTAGEPGG
jgi:hypothetical protein